MSGSRLLWIPPAIAAVVAKSVAELLGRVRADLAELDLIVLDLKMPHATGVDLVRSVRKLDSGHLPILVFSGSVSSAEEVKRARPRWAWAAT